MKRSAALILLGLAMPGVVLAGAPADSAETAEDEVRWTMTPVRVRADLLPDPLGPFPLATTRLDSSVIARRPGGDLGELLPQVAGLRVTAWGDGALGSTVSVRGSSPEQVLLLVDGRRRASAQGGGADLAEVSLDTVESVEVLRGGSSALWGADALGGAIHVRTRRPTSGSAKLRLAGGAHGRRQLSGDGAIALGERWTVQAHARSDRSDGTSPFRDDGTDGTRSNADLARVAGSLRADGVVRGVGRLRLDASGLEGERGVPGSVEFPTPTARLKDRFGEVGTRWSREGVHVWQPTMDVSWQQRRRTYDEPDAPFGAVRDRHRNDRWRGEFSLDRVGTRISTRFATGMTRDRLDSSTDGRRARDTFDARLRSTLDVRRGPRSLQITAAVRVDDASGFSPFVSPRIGALLDLVPRRLTLRASAGRSWRAPSFDELFWPARATAAGNPDLSPEHGLDVDTGFALSKLPLGGRLSVDGFARRVEDLIQWVPGASGVWRPHNVGAATLHGVETSAGLALPLGGERRLAVEGGVTWLESLDRSGEANVDGRALVYRPRWTSTLAARVQDPRAGELEAMVRSVDDVFVTRANTKTLPGYVVLDLRYRRDLGPPATVDVALTNVTDENARDFRDFPLPGRTWTVGLTVRRSP